jgi:hypothetical protein
MPSHKLSLQQTDSNRGAGSDTNSAHLPKQGGKKKGAPLPEPPKIATPSVDMYKQPAPLPGAPPANKPDQSNISKKVINFQQNEKTPFEKELDLKATEIKNQKKMLINGPVTQEQLKLQKYKEDSISILKQLQESGNIVLNDSQKPETSHPKKGSVDNKQRLVIDMVGDGKKKVKATINIGGPAAG